MTDRAKVEFLKLSGDVLLLKRDYPLCRLPAIGTSMTFDHHVTGALAWSEPKVWVVTDVRHVYKDGYLEKVLVICRPWTDADQNERYNERD